MSKGLRLDLGSGANPQEGFEGVDIVPDADYTVDLQAFPWPWKDDSVEAAVSSHLVEHLPDIVGFMRELHRVMRDGATVEIRHPYQWHERSMQDPTHVRVYNDKTFYYFDKKWRGGAAWGEWGDTDFEVVDCIAIPDPAWQQVAEEHPDEFEKAARCMINVVADLAWILRCRKNEA